MVYIILQVRKILWDFSASRKFIIFPFPSLKMMILPSVNLVSSDFLSFCGLDDGRKGFNREDRSPTSIYYSCKEDCRTFPFLSPLFYSSGLILPIFYIQFWYWRDSYDGGVHNYALKSAQQSTACALKLDSLIAAKICGFKIWGHSLDPFVLERHSWQYGTALSASRSVLVDVLECDGRPDCELNRMRLRRKGI